MTNHIRISSFFDAGNIEVVDAKAPEDIRLRIRKDSQSEFLQWFYFRLQGGMGENCVMVLENAQQAAFAEGWEGYQAVASYDREYWFRVPTKYVNGQLVIEHTPDQDSVYYAYFAPYSYERHLDMLSWAASHEDCITHHLGETAQGRDITLLEVSKTQGLAKNIWIIARQHPGETMAEWFVEGLLERLFDENHPVARALLQQCRFYIVPNMNPDGAALGNLRVNSKGVNLNREWNRATMERSPEVLAVQKKMAETGVDLFLDIHGDESIPANFVDGCSEVPNFTESMAKAEQLFTDTLLAVSPDFQTELGYEKDRYGEANLSLASKWVGNTYECLSLTLEMPFKDHDPLPDPITGWSPERAKILGADVLYPIYQVINAKLA
ncbi:carboxypeptidase family protein [Maribrevibacterium harenarium]|uniref:Carboxypeptidase family protein n=1 Tax=Maribrevibacterium harenarium TaxID=2589817 RepID=A0A501X575_9GAMM|nr:carboxypeptidase family protein [Maribrevibacterium harenarium]TPE55593.1 carboxypeptidase family protein [Maribrevibacterium harenarium]